MKSLKTLIRLQKRELDQLRKQLNTFENQRGHLIAMIEKLQADLLREIETSQELAEMRGFFGDFSHSIKKRQKALAANVVQVETQIQNLMVQIQNHYTDLKKYEIAYDRFLAAEAKKQAKAEQEELDEAGLHKFHYGE